MSTCKTRQNRQITYSTVQFKLDLAKFRCQLIFVSAKESYCCFFFPLFFSLMPFIATGMASFFPSSPAKVLAKYFVCSIAHCLDCLFVYIFVVFFLKNCRKYAPVNLSGLNKFNGEKKCTRKTQRKRTNSFCSENFLRISMQTRYIQRHRHRFNYYRQNVHSLFSLVQVRNFRASVRTTTREKRGKRVNERMK